MKKRITAIFLALTLALSLSLSVGSNVDAASRYFSLNSPKKNGSYDLNGGVEISVTSKDYSYIHENGFITNLLNCIVVEVMKDGKRQYFGTFPYTTRDLQLGKGYMMFFPIVGSTRYDMFKPKIPGIYTVRTGFINNYSSLDKPDKIENVIDSYNFKVTFKPKATKISSIKPGRKSFLVKWKKQTNLTTGYQIRYSVKSSMASAKKVTIRKKGTTSRTVARLKSKKKYYVQVRTYHKLAGKTYFSFWSAKKAVKVK